MGSESFGSGLGETSTPILSAPTKHRVLFGEPLGGGNADAGTAFGITYVVLAPELAPSRVQYDRVARLQLQLLSCKRLFDVLHGDFVSVGQDLHTFQSGDVNQHASRHQRTDVLDAQLLKPVAGRRIAHLEAVVHAVADCLVRESVELRAHLADFANDELFVAAASIRLRDS